ncbi:MAG TPA: tRNA lysidine(34) synthetase TilS [Thermoanaerobaculia bacterium]|nr:tRNA lysidine(34) synthetase TilS [Thermoanaerobaculia bacterium]
MEIFDILEAFFRVEAPLRPGDGVVAAFSGGPDSTALLLGLARLASRRGIRVVAAHLDHAVDSGSGERARQAARLAATLSTPFVTARRDVPALRRAGESPEAAARRLRYGFLEEVRRETGSRFIATAHHRDDQAETVLLRLLFGSGVLGLSGIRPVHGAVVRPLLALPRAELARAVRAAGLSPVDDPTNRDLAAPRNRLRHSVLPRLAAEDSGLPARLARLAGKAARATEAVERRLGAELSPREVPGGIAVGRRELEEMPESLLPFALARLHRKAGAPYPAGAAARAELLRQIARGGAGCDCGDGWRWVAAGDLLVLARREERERVPHFTYTREVPGELDIPELAVRVGLRRVPVEPWMFTGSSCRAGLSLPLADGDRVTVRNRRPGDRLHPLGASGSRRLKEVLVDRRIPRHQRERLPLLCVGERIAWVPGVTIEERFRLRAGETTAWVAEVTTR